MPNPSRLLALLILAAATTSLPVAAAPGSKCAAAKLKACGVRTMRTAKCHARALRKGRAVAQTCVDAAGLALHRAFDEAERRKRDCLSLDDAEVLDVSTAAYVSGVLSALPHDETPASRGCSATKLLATARRSAIVLRCAGRGMARGAAPKERCLAKAVTKFERAFARADKRGGCVSQADAETLAPASDGFAIAVGIALGAATTSSTSTSTSITTSSTAVAGTSTTTTTLQGQTTTSTLVPDASTTTTTSTTLPAAVSFAADVQPIFTANCAVPGCHTGVFPQQNLDLSPGKAHAELVGIPSEQCPLFLRVHPGNPSASYLLFKLAGPPQPCLIGNRMPSGGASPLSPEDQALIAAWIAQGAPND